MTLLPSDLTSRLEKIFSQEEMVSLWEIFKITKRQTSFRCNVLKASPQEIEKELEKSNISYTKIGFPENCYLLDRSFSESDLWSLDIYTQWKIYVQGISSQIPPLLFSAHTWWKQLRILDACAAPGGKTSQLSALYPDSEIYAFEPNKIRYEKMCHNLKKLWCGNVKTIHDSIEHISKHIWEEEYFDMILIDAPCSGEWALSYHNTKFIENWSLTHIKKNYKRQKNICDNTLPYLKEWWELIYSTCTIAPEENEWVIHYLLCHYSELKLIKLDFIINSYIKPLRALKSFEKYHFKKEVSEHALRVIPSEYSEWFFIAKLKKWVSKI